MSEPVAPEQGPLPPAPADPGCINLRWSMALLRGLLRAGLRTLVLSPGARSTPLVIAAQRLAHEPGEGDGRRRLELVTIVDERSAGFFALGAATAGGRPVALLATSGSAPAHWYPAVIEADAAGLPLVLLSADRPPRLRGWGANQTIDQTRLFGAFVRECHDPGLPSDSPAAMKAIHALGLRAGSQSLGPRPGPVHLNLPFDEPLLPAGPCDPVRAAPDTAPSWSSESTAPHALGDRIELPAGHGLILCGPGRFGPDFAPAVQQAAHALGVPVLADPLSGLRFGDPGDAVISHYDALLRNATAAAALRPDWVLRFGRAAISKQLGNWLEGVPAIGVDPAGGWSDPSHDLIARLTLDPAAACRALAKVSAATGDRSWLLRWQAAETRVEALATAHLSASPWCEGQLIRDLMARLPAGEALLCANSMPIRQLDTWSGRRSAPLALHGNRGASGIDGQLSTLAGLDHAGPPAWGLLGDLSFCHDLSGLLRAPGLRRPVLVIDNGGGRIFDYLPQRALPDFGSLWRTPIDVDLNVLAAAVGLPHRQVESKAQWQHALAELLDAPGPMLIQVRIDADQSRRTHQAFWQRVASDTGFG